ncbi:hypothetical protein L596_026887 [Steinernema carpocapsae]|uniref:Uncharacterized protein n=1 Tax=Steinernema carpocapsae TaxID=34508 RepID=A0A4U5M2N5_STECR|nr:hypothetical protein L596_026887 [Steinernema carpocapsae]
MGTDGGLNIGGLLNDFTGTIEGVVGGLPLLADSSTLLSPSSSASLSNVVLKLVFGLVGGLPIVGNVTKSVVLESDRADRSGLLRVKPTCEGRQQRLRDTTDV